MGDGKDDAGMYHETIECGYCGLTMRDNERTRQEMELHEAECNGINDPKERFEKGDRVEYSDLGRERLDVEPRQGEIVGFGSERHHNAHCVLVKWDGRKTAERYAHSFIKHSDENLVNLEGPK